MAYIQTCRSIRMDKDVLETLQDTNQFLRDIWSDLEKIAKDDEYYHDLSEQAFKAYAALDDFLECYKEEVKNP